MYEYEAAAVRLGIEFLQAMTEEDYLLDPTFDVLNLEQRLNEIQADINLLVASLPVEAIDDDNEREQEYPDDFEDSEELEDEVVECERLIGQATLLIAKVREWYLPSEASLAALSSTPSSEPKESAQPPKRSSKPNRGHRTDWTFLWIIIILGILIAAAILS